MKKLISLILSEKQYCRLRKIKHKAKRLIGFSNKNKGWFENFYNSRESIKNWFFLYLFSTSFLIDYYFKIYALKKHARRLKVKAKYRNNMILFFPAFTSRYYGMFIDIVAYQYIGDYEKYYKKKFSLKKNDIVIDVGAHVGKFSIPLVREFSGINIFAFEPDPDNFECLEKNFHLNLDKVEKYNLYQSVVSNNVDEKIFSLGMFSTTGSLKTIGFSYENKNAKHIKVKSITLEKLFKENNINNCALLKMDCEGSEYLIFESLPKDILNKINMIFIEVHITKDNNPLMLKSYLERNGFIVKGHKRPDGGWELFCVNSLNEAE